MIITSIFARSEDTDKQLWKSIPALCHKVERLTKIKAADAETLTKTAYTHRPIKVDSIPRQECLFDWWTSSNSAPHHTFPMLELWGAACNRFSNFSKLWMLHSQQLYAAMSLLSIHQHYTTSAFEVNVHCHPHISSFYFEQHFCIP